MKRNYILLLSLLTLIMIGATMWLVRAESQTPSSPAGEPDPPTLTGIIVQPQVGTVILDDLSGSPSSTIEQQPPALTGPVNKPDSTNIDFSN